LHQLVSYFNDALCCDSKRQISVYSQTRRIPQLHVKPDRPKQTPRAQGHRTGAAAPCKCVVLCERFDELRERFRVT